MKLLHIKTHKHAGIVEVKLDDDVYEKYKNSRIRHQQSGDMGSSYVNVLDESTGKYVSFARTILGITDRKIYVGYRNGDETDLRRENLTTLTRGDINRTRHPKFYGRMFKGTQYTDNVWYTVVYLPANQKFMKRCSTEAEAALVYDSTLNYLGLEGYRNFPDEAGTKHLTDQDKTILNQKRKLIRGDRADV